MRVFVNSFPKSGTNLVGKLLTLLDIQAGPGVTSSLILGRHKLIKSLLRSAHLPGNMLLIGLDIPVAVRKNWLARRLEQVQNPGFSLGHVLYTSHFASVIEALNFKVILVIRDPRDIVVSHAHYISNEHDHFLHSHYTSLGDWHKQLAFSITGGMVPGVGYLESVRVRGFSVDGWLQKKGILILRFEDLIGPLGGGTQVAQREAICRVGDFLEIKISADKLDTVCNSLHGGTHTFRKGLIGSWREEFAAEHHSLFEQEAANLLEHWGYQ
jgi:hypothetical protein